MKKYRHVAEAKYMVVWVRGKVRTFHWYSLKVMRLIILYSAVYQLRVASPAHVNEITMPTCRAHTHTHYECAQFLWGQWKFTDSNRFGLADRSDISALTPRATASLLLLCVSIPYSAPSVAQMCSNTCWRQHKASGNWACCLIYCSLVCSYATIIYYLLIVRLLSS